VRAAHTRDDYVFPSATGATHIDTSKAARTAIRKAGIANFRFHDTRHTAASYLAMRSASMLEVGEVLGHRSVQSTKRYAHLSTAHTRDVLSAMVTAVFPRGAEDGDASG
jgi:integrase